MDTHLSECSGDMVVVTGLGYEIPMALRTWFAGGLLADGQESASLAHDADPVPFLRVRKTAKFMSKQDRLALSAAARAVSTSGLNADELETKTLVAMAVGAIPFQEGEARDVAEHSCVDKRFSEERFCQEAYEAFNPMLLFACLPNMPAYHISANLQMRGGYYLTYPSCAESYLALRNAMDALSEGRAQAALFGGVADQQNFLVRNHHRKGGQTLPAPDCACFLVLETLNHAQARKAPILARLSDFEIGNEQGSASPERTCYLGPVELPLEVARLIEGTSDRVRHRLDENELIYESGWSR